MHQSLAKFSESEASNHAPSWADFITTMVGFRVFGTHRGVQEYLASLERDDQVICSALEWMESEEWRAAAPVESALASYVSRRKPRVEWVQHQSMAVGESLIMPSAVRNALLRQRGNEAMHARFGPLVSAPWFGPRTGWQRNK